MNSSIIQQFSSTYRITTEAWPVDAELYQPHAIEQILLPVNASCLAVKAYLRMCGLPYKVVAATNAEFMSPGGRLTKLPFIRAGSFVYAEFEPIVEFVEQKNTPLARILGEDAKADMRSYVTLVENVFTLAGLYVSYMNDRVYKEVTAPRNASAFPWPLSWVQNRVKRNNALRTLKVYQWDDMDMDDVVEKIDKCCEILTLKLEETKGPFFYADGPCELDAITFGHVHKILTTELPDQALAQTVQTYSRLVEFCRFIDQTYFQSKDL